MVARDPGGTKLSKALLPSTACWLVPQQKAISLGLTAQYVVGRADLAEPPPAGHRDRRELAEPHSGASVPELAHSLRPQQ